MGESDDVLHITLSKCHRQAYPVILEVVQDTGNVTPGKGRPKLCVYGYFQGLKIETVSSIKKKKDKIFSNYHVVHTLPSQKDLDQIFNDGKIIDSKNYKTVTVNDPREKEKASNV